jgi:hypothetical protein
MESNCTIPIVFVKAVAQPNRRKEVTEENFGFPCSLPVRTDARANRRKEVTEENFGFLCSLSVRREAQRAS